MPVTFPVSAPASAMPDELLLHVPPGVAFVKDAVMPAHKLVVPEIADTGFTVTTFVSTQPVLNW